MIHNNPATRNSPLFHSTLRGRRYRGGSAGEAGSVEAGGMLRLVALPETSFCLWSWYLYTTSWRFSVSTDADIMPSPVLPPVPSPNPPAPLTTCPQLTTESRRVWWPFR